MSRRIRRLNLTALGICRQHPQSGAGYQYEVRLKLSDPDGGAEEKNLSAKTRRLPVQAKDGGRSVHIYPEGYSGTRETPNYASVDLAGKDLQPGDNLLLHAGSYPNILLKGGGTKEGPSPLRLPVTGR